MTLNSFGTPVEHYALLVPLFERYRDLAEKHSPALANLAPRCQGPALTALCTEAIDKGPTYPFDKMNRWLGFVQGVLAAKGIIDVDTERSFTRPVLHMLHSHPVKTWET